MLKRTLAVFAVSFMMRMPEQALRQLRLFWDTAIICFVAFFFISCESCQEWEDANRQRDQVTRELDSFFKQDVVRVFISGNSLVVVNQSEIDWKNVRVLLNPYEDFVDGRTGFEYPKTLSLSNGTRITIALRDLVHTKTRERFDLQKYAPVDVKVSMEFYYRSENFARSFTVSLEK